MKRTAFGQRRVGFAATCPHVAAGGDARLNELPNDPHVNAQRDEACRAGGHAPLVTISAEVSAAALEEVCSSTGTLPAFMPPGAYPVCFAELTRCGAIASGGLASGVFTNQAARAGLLHMQKYPELYKYCSIYLLPFLRALRKVPGQRLQGHPDAPPPFAFRQADGIMTLARAADGNHTDQLSSFDLYSRLSPEEKSLVDSGKLLIRARFLFSSGQAVSLRMPHGIQGGSDWQVELRAPPGGGAFMAERVRCWRRDVPTTLTHATLTTDVDGVAFGPKQQVFLDIPVYNPDGSARVASQFGLFYATGAVRRALPQPSSSSDVVEEEAVADGATAMEM